MPNLTSEDWIFVLFLFDSFVSIVVGLAIDKDERHIALEYQEYVGCLCIGPVLFVVNMFGVGIILVFKFFGILGPWWTWAIGIALPYVFIAIVLLSNRGVNKAKIK